ncbi:MAG: Bacteriophage protein [Pseudomonas helleri]|jgi:uncharacterized protein
MTPTFRIVADGADITSLINDRLLLLPGRTDLFAERSINAQGFKTGLDGEYLVDSVEQVFTQSGWSTTVECNGGEARQSQGKWFEACSAAENR